MICSTCSGEFSESGEMLRITDERKWHSAPAPCPECTRRGVDTFVKSRPVIKPTRATAANYLRAILQNSIQIALAALAVWCVDSLIRAGYYFTASILAIVAIMWLVWTVFCFGATIWWFTKR